MDESSRSRRSLPSSTSCSVSATYRPDSDPTAGFTSTVISSSKRTESYSSDGYIWQDSPLLLTEGGIITPQLFVFVTGLIFGFKIKLKFLQVQLISPPIFVK